MYVRTAGRSLLTKVDRSPYFLKYDSVSSRCDFLKRTYLPYFITKALPARIPIKYAIHEPTKFPNEPASTTNAASSFPEKTRYPENGIIISLGIGIRALFATMSRNMQ